MKKLGTIGLLVVMGLVVGYFVLQMRGKVDRNLSAEDLAIRAIGQGHEADYLIEFDLDYKAGTEPSREITSVEGVLTLSSRNDEEQVGTWKKIDRLLLEGQTIPSDQHQGILGKASITDSTPERYSHFLGNDFPTNFLRAQTMILDRLIPHQVLDEKSSVSMDEKDDQVPFTAKYSISKQGALTYLRKEMVSYKNADSKFDPKLNTIDYIFDADKKLLGAKGRVRSIFSQKDGSTRETLITFSAKALNTRPLSTELKAVAKSQLSPVDAPRVGVSDAQNRADQGRTFEEALKELDQVTAETDGGAYYDIFRSLTDHVRVDPTLSEAIRGKILAEKKRDEGSKRKLAAMFGALAESGHSQGADTLTSLAKECEDKYCKSQALMGINTHVKPSAKNTQELLALSASESDKEVAATALIAAGATGRKIDEAPPELGRELIRSYADPARVEMKTSTLAAMGNHGSREYLPTLKESLKAPDSSVRSAAAYSLRYVQDDSVNPALVEVIQKEEISSVVSEAMKAAGFRKLSSDDYSQIASSASQFKNKELAEQAAGLLLDAYRKDPSSAQAALQSFQEKTKYGDVKTYIESEVKKFQSAK